jgi:transposase InsO family protein
MQLIDEAVQAGAHRASASAHLGVSVRSVQRWKHKPEDARTLSGRTSPPNKFSDNERQALLDAACREEFASLTPHQIVPKLADQGIYLGSESTFYRVLKAENLSRRRGRASESQRRAPTTHRADGPNQLWCWDITWMPTTIRGRYFYWYMMKDVYSRMLVGNEVWEVESGEHASALLTKACLIEGTVGRPLVLHSDNGSAMKGALMRATMTKLNVESSFSRPRVSNDNAYAEALFRTAKYCPMWPERPFDTLDEARTWVQKFVAWYNDEHCHSGLKYVTPSQRHSGQADELLTKRRALYEQARAKNPTRWSGDTRNWKLADLVYLNPEKTEESAIRYKDAA